MKWVPLWVVSILVAISFGCGGDKSPSPDNNPTQVKASEVSGTWRGFWDGSEVNIVVGDFRDEYENIAPQGGLQPLVAN